MSRRLLSQKLSQPLDDWLRTGMTIEFLGTSSARPTKSRNVSSLLVHHTRHSFMFDCGDGTLRQLLTSPIARAHRIKAVFITHLHCDHFYGLPAVAARLYDRESEDTNPKKMDPETKKIVYSPRGLRQIMGELVQRNLNIVEFGSCKTGKHHNSALAFSEHIIYEDSDVQIAAIFIRHSIACAGYIFKEKAVRKIDAQILLEKYKLGPGPVYKKLLNMEEVESPIDGSIIPLEKVVYESPGRTIVILGDTWDPTSVIPYAKDCDLLIHEATGVESDRTQILKTFHSTGAMAGGFAQNIKAKHLVLNHFSPRQVLSGIPCDEGTYQQQVLQEAKEAAGQEVLVTAAYDHLAIPIPRKISHDHCRVLK